MAVQGREKPLQLISTPLAKFFGKSRGPGSSTHFVAANVQLPQGGLTEIAQVLLESFQDVPEMKLGCLGIEMVQYQTGRIGAGQYEPLSRIAAAIAHDSPSARRHVPAQGTIGSYPTG